MNDSTNSWQIFRVTVHRNGADYGADDDGPVVEVTPERSTAPEASLPDRRQTRVGKHKDDRDQR
jgi:hypothetical protein